MSAASELIAKAILEKKAISATYQNRYREMCPHTLGYKNDKEHALMYQFGGDSKSGLSPGGSGENVCAAVPLSDHGPSEQRRHLYVKTLLQAADDR